MWKFPAAVIGVFVVGYLLINGLPSFEAAPVAPRPIVLGFIGPLTGDGANLGQHSKAAVELATDEVNAAGGIHGRPLQFIYEDGGCNATTTTIGATKLISADKVSVILGGACASEAAALASLAEQSRTVAFSYCSSAAALSAAGDYVFRNYPSDTSQGLFAAQYIADTLKKSKIAVLYVNTDWGVAIKNIFKSEFKKKDGIIVAEEKFEYSSRDFRTVLAKIKAKKPQLLYMLGYTDESIAALKQAAELKFVIPFFGSTAWDDPKIFAAAGKIANGAMYPVVSSSLNDEFRAKMQAKIGSDDIFACSPNAYDAVHLLARVIKQAGTGATAIKNELYKTVYLGGVSMPEVRFDDHGDLVGEPYVVMVAKDGKAEERK